MRNQRSMRTLAVTLAVLLLTLFSACKVTDEDIENWKGTVKGPGKLVAVILTPKYSMELRSRAAIALVEMERNDVEGIVELQHALHRLDEQTRTELIDTMKDPLISLMRGGAAAQPGAPTAGPTPLQIRAKDAGFLLITDSSAATRAALTNAVVGWYVEDFNGRALSGKFSAEQVVRQLGAPAATVLVSALNEHMPKEAIIKLSELIGQLGEAATKATAATRLIAIERAMESDEFLNWVKGKIRQQMSAGGGAVDENRVNAGAVLNREQFINDGALPAMKFLADQAVVANRLIEIAAAPTQSETRRTRALLALEGKATEAQLEPLLNMALESSTPVSVRDTAFDRIGDVRSTSSLVRLWPLIVTGSDQRVRWRVGELVLGIGGVNVVAEFISKLPSAPNTEYAPEELDGYAQRFGQMTPLPTDAMRAQLQSPRWYLRVIALRFFARKGVAADEAAMRALTSDSAPVHGPTGSAWPANGTVGRAATEAIEFMHERLAAPAEEAH